ncbi:uncharacterized protein isoform X2 [Musca autumnalis]|uniref:uncharacterized protein isoform X2 n=1 Tax=Musca autumnalis TaxID=221902 RepID=UPI003CE8169B
MLFKQFVSSCILLAALYAGVNSAPTHHLTIGVDGNTPTLKVTSAELGLTANKAKHLSEKPMKTRKDLHPIEKLKILKSKTNVSYKKDKSIYFSKSVALKTTPSLSITDVPTVNQTKEVAYDNQLPAMTTPLSNVKVSPSTAETTAIPILASTLDSTTVLTTEQTLSESVTDQNILDQTTRKQNKLITHPTESISSRHVSTEVKLNSNDIPELLMDNTTLVTLGIYESDEPSTITEVLNATLHTSTARIDFIDNSTNDMDTSFSTSAPFFSSSNPKDENESIRSSQTEIVGETNTTPQSNWSVNEDFTSSSTERLQESYTLPLTTGYIVESESTSTTILPSTAETSTFFANSEQIQGFTTTSIEPILKLIDLEQHNTEVVDARAHNNGHDGLKNIKKKQLIDKHYTDSIRHSKEVESLKNDETINMEIKHGYLGPILMEEKRVHVEESEYQPQHLTSIETEIRKGHLVELKANHVEGVTLVTTAQPLPPPNEGETTLEDTVMQTTEEEIAPSTVLSTTVFQAADGLETKIPSKSANTMFTSTDVDNEEHSKSQLNGKMESKISDIQIEVYDSTIDSIVASTNFKDADISTGKSTKPPLPIAQQERFTQYVIDRTETSTQESINFSTIQVASGKPEPAAIEIHINVSESLGSDNDDVDVSFPLSEYNTNGRGDEATYDDVKASDDIKLKIASDPPTTNLSSKDKSDEVLVVEIVDNVENSTESRGKTRSSDELFITDVKETYVTPPPPPPPPPFQTTYDRDSDTIFYISNTEVKVGETLPSEKKDFDERKMKLENQFFPVNYMASTHPNVNTANKNDGNAAASDHNMYEEDIIVSSNSGNQADALKIYRNHNEPSPPLDVTYVGESIIEVEQQSPDSGVTSNAPIDHAVTPITLQPDVIIQPAILPEISIGVPVIGELPPQIELKEIDYMPNEMHRPFGSSDERKPISANSNDVDNHLDESSVQYGGDLIDESADGGFDGVEGSYPFGNPATLEKRKPNHMADYAHLYVNYGVNNMRKDELTADIKDSGDVALILDHKSGDQNEQLNATFKEFLNKMIFNHSSSVNETERNTNVTAFSIMEDSMEDKNAEDIISLISLAIGLFIVILPVVVTCSMLWALRYLYKKYHSSSADNNGNVDAADTKGHASEDAAEKGEDMSRVARETKMDYNKDGVFVVEVARGVDSKTIPDSPIAEESQKVISMFEPKHNGTVGYKVSNEKITHNNEKVQIHSPPPEKSEEGPRSLHQIEEVEEPVHSPRLENNGEDGIIGENFKSNVGLSQSDLSSTSSNDSNKGYCYGNQELYVVEQSGYSTTSPTGNISLKCDSKDIKDDDRNPENGKNIEATPERKEESKENKNSTNDLNNEKNIGSVDDDHVGQDNDHQQEVDITEGELKINHAEVIPKPAEEAKEPISIDRVVETEEKVEDITNDKKAEHTHDISINENDVPIDSSTSIQEDEKCDDGPNDGGSLIQNNCTAMENGEIPVLNKEVIHSDTPETTTIAENVTSDAIMEEKTKENVDDMKSITNVTEPDNDCKMDKVPEQPVLNKEVVHSDTLETTTIAENVTSDPIMEEKTKEDVDDMKSITNVTEPDNDCKTDKVPEEPVSQENIAENLGHNEQISQNGINESDHDEEVEQLPKANGNYENTTSQEIIGAEIEKNNGDEFQDRLVEHDKVSLKTVDDNDNTNGVKEVNDEKHNDIENNVNIERNHVCDNGPSHDVIMFNGHIVNSPTKGESSDTSVCNDLKPEIISQTKNELGTIIKANGHMQESISEGADCNNTNNGTLHLPNGSDILPDLVPVHTNGTEFNGIHNNQTEFENGYDSIISLPEPPPSTDEMLCSDLSELQLDSLPPPPPPLVNEINGEIFSLKDLPPPLTNAVPEPQPTDETGNIFATLPPPPPTTLHVSSSPAMNGNMHASPLTPPASPPPHFTNGLHTGLCPPIAVDVNGS